MKDWLKTTAAWARRVGIRVARPVLRPLDRHLAGVLAAALAERFNQLSSATEDLSRSVEAAQATCLQCIREANVLGEATIRELVRCQRQIESLEHLIEEPARPARSAGCDAAGQQTGDADPLPPAEAA